MARSSQLIVNGIPTHVRSAGSGPTLALLHGMASTSDCWDYTIEAFQSDYQVIAPDLPGHGLSEGNRKPYNLRFYVDWLGDLIAQHGATQPIALAGNSMGGAISLAYAMERPDHVRRLALVDPLGLNDGFPWAAISGWLRRAHHWALAVITRRLDPYLMRAVSPWIFRDPWGPSYQSLMRTAALNLKQGFWAFGAGLRLTLSDFLWPRQRREFLDRVAEIDIPMLVVWGRHDGLLPYSRATVGLSRLKSVRVAVFEKSAHSAMLEEPAKFNALMREFLADRSTQRKPKRTRRSR